MTQRLTFLDRYLAGSSLLHKLDPRLKLLGTLAYVVAATTLPEGAWVGLALLALLALALVRVAQVPLLTALKRSSVALPFVGMVAISLPFTHRGDILWATHIAGRQLAVTDQGLVLFGTLLAKGWLSVLLSGLLVATTPFPALVQAMRRLHVPEILTTIISFMVRYLFVLVDEALRLMTARQARSVGRGRNVFWRARVLGGMVGSLFIRSYERSEHIYNAMLARGYAGQLLTMGTLHWRSVDSWSGLTWAVALLVVSLIGRLTYLRG